MAATIATSLATDSPNLRRELLTWLSENASGIIRANEEDRITLLTACFNCLQDRAVEVRKAASSFLDACVDYITGEAILKSCQATRPALLAQVKQIVDSHVAKPGIAIVQPQIPTSGAVLSKTPQKASAAPGSMRTPRKGEVDEPAGKIFITSELQIKTNRLEAEAKGTFKWAFDAPRAEFCDHLRGVMQGCLSSLVIKQLFSDDFKEAINGIGLIDAAVSSGQEKDGVICNVDLILKYLTIRLFDSNTTVLIKTFDLIEHVLGLIDEANLRLSETEATAFLPHFVQRAGEMKEPIKNRLRGIYRQLCRVYPASKIFVFLLDGLRSKSSRARVECLNEMEVLITRNGLMVVQAAKHIPILASVISDRDSNVRNAALNVLVQLHELLGEVIYKHMAGISQKDLDLFGERLRRFKDKTLPQEMEVDEPHDNVEDEEKTTEQSSQPREEVPRVFALDPTQYGSPVRPTRLSIAGTPYAAYSNIAPTPALPAMTSLYQPPSLDDPLDRVIQLIGASTDLECISALQRLDEFMATPISLLSKISPLVGALVVRLHECTNSMMDVDVALKSRLCRYVTNALVLICTDRMLIQQVDTPTLTLLIRETLLCLVHGQTMGQLEDRDQVGRALNVLLVKCLEHGDRNSCYRSLLGLLEQAFRTSPLADDKYPEFVMKCLWKLTKQLSGSLQAGEVKVGELLIDIHNFFCALPPMEWKTRAAQKLPMEDLPLRTVKTILHELAATLGDRVIPSVRQIENAEQSFVTSYLRAMLVANNIDVSGLDFSRYPAPVLVSKVTPEESVPLDELEDILKDICSKICSKPNTRTGLAELYELQRQHPYAADFIDAYLEKLGNFFYKYIKRNLAHIEAEMSRAMENNVPANDSNFVNSFTDNL
jgi:cytoskeleton-associated protein 5